nr:hypothetical protein [Tanacetum cinerariifolium]
MFEWKSYVAYMRFLPVAFRRIRDAFSVYDLHYRFFTHSGFKGFRGYLHGGYILESDHEDDLEEDDEDPEEDPADYLTDREDEEEEESFKDDADEEDEDKDEEEHPAPNDSVSPPVHRVTARMYVRSQTPISLPSKIEVAKLLAVPILLPLSPLSSPLPQILSPLP